MREKKQPFILGLSRPSNIKYLHCPQHQGARLIPSPEGYQCPLGCGPIPPTEVASDTRITSRFAVTKGKQIASGHNRSYKEKQYYDKSGNKINPNDPDIMQDLARGATIEYYHTTEDLNPKQPIKHIVKR